MNSSTFVPRRSQRLSQSSIVRFPSEARSPTPGKLHRVSTPGRISESRYISKNTSPMRTLSSDDEDEEDDGLPPSRIPNFPKVILLKDNGDQKKTKNYVSDQIISSWTEVKNKLRSLSLLDKRTLIFLINACAILAFLFFGLKSLPLSALTSVAYADIRFMAMVAPDFLFGMLTNPSEEMESGQHLNIDLIVNKIINNEKFGNFVRGLQKNSQEENLDVVVTPSLNFEHSEEIRASIQQLQDRFQSNKASLEEQLSSLWKQFEELKALKEETHRKELTAFEGKLQELNNKLGAVKDYIIRSESIVQKCESQVKDMSSKTNGYIRDYVNELIHDNSSKLSRHLQDQFVSQKDMNFIIEDMQAHFRTISSHSSDSSVVGNIDHFVEKALIKYDADKTGMFDFALETAGGTILSTRCTETYDVSWAVHTIFGIPFWWERNNARTILQPSSNPGQCWAFKGSQGSVVIELSRHVNIEAFSLEHMSKMMAPERKIESAPKRFTVLGLSSLDDESPIVFGNFTYDDNGNPVQTFRVAPTSPVKLVELKILSNYGHLVYTCVYRFRVHGTFAELTPDKKGSNH